MLQHRSVDFFEHVKAHLDAVIGMDADDVRVECRVMDFTERQPVGDLRLPFGIAVRDDVRGLQQLVVPQATNRAMFAVDFQHSLVERLPVEALTNTRPNVKSAAVCPADVSDCSCSPSCCNTRAAPGRSPKK